MNCLEFQRELRTDPRARNEAVASHMRDCAACASRFKRAQSFERKLGHALRVPAPEKLASRVLLRQRLSGTVPEEPAREAALSRRPRWRNRTWLALAASIAAVAVVTGIAFERITVKSALADDVVHMTRTATYALMAEGPVQTTQIEATLRSVGAGLEGQFENKVRFAGRCTLMGKTAGHLVLEGSRAPITVFVMPWQPLERRSAIDSEYWDGALVPVDGGSVAIVAAPGEPIEAVEATVRKILRFEPPDAPETPA